MHRKALLAIILGCLVVGAVLAIAATKPDSADEPAEKTDAPKPAAADKAVPKEVPAKPVDKEKAAQEAEAAMRKELGDKFHYRRVRCFVVAGDAPQGHFNRSCRGTIAQSYDAYQKQFFDKKPAGIFKVYLFKNATSYRAYVKKRYGREPSTPYGFYSDHRRSLVMNIGTGGGTLVHEMFHALVQTDFPDIPSWANEGIASLFEQCTYVNGKLVGLVNWRLPILKKAIRDKSLPSLREIMKMTSTEFYRERAGKYAAARYFMLRLQKKGLLVKFYKGFRDNYKKDKTGITVAEKLLGEKLEEFEPEWRKWVMKLQR